MSNQPSSSSTEFETSCSRWTCDADAVAERVEDGILVKCKEGHVESSTFQMSDSSGPQKSDVDHEDEEMPVGASRGQSRGHWKMDDEVEEDDDKPGLKQGNGYDRERPSKGETGSTHNNRDKRAPVVDPSSYVEDDR